MKLPKPFLLLMLVLMCLTASAQTSSALSDNFSKETFTLGMNTLAYRKAVIAEGSTSQPALVLYLHGGTSRGDDNELQLAEKAVGVIFQYIASRHIPAVMLVPQCPANGGWTGQLRRVVHEMVKVNLALEGCDASRVYVMGGSMGGTGTWTQLSYFPDFYAAALPVAGNPTGLDAANVATTPVRTVMGTDDSIMSIPAVEAFQADVQAAGGTLLMETEEGWTHQDTCEESYTDLRLDWLFSQTKKQSTAIGEVFAGGDESQRGYDVSGRVVSLPVRGVFIRHGKKTVKR